MLVNINKQLFLTLHLPNPSIKLTKTDYIAVTDIVSMWLQEHVQQPTYNAYTYPIATPNRPLNPPALTSAVYTLLGERFDIPPNVFVAPLFVNVVLANTGILIILRSEYL